MKTLIWACTKCNEVQEHEADSEKHRCTCGRSWVRASDYFTRDSGYVFKIDEICHQEDHLEDQ